ncbi:hypothetical protein T10_12433 [Trichinella papuae]|uniref:KRAB-A domain-containing protein 2 n=1 Tax=Trichinella papuae TaxID=268474 RepID=A0A0V1N8I3_9BILA|nr:hypothetical protein T10_12433 [Trichinella papuae]
MITDILRIQPDGPKSVRDYNLKNRCKALKIGKENKYNLIGQIAHDGGKTFLEAQNKWTNVTPEPCQSFFTFCYKFDVTSPGGLDIGQNTTLRVPDVNRGPVDLKNFLVVIMTECEGLYTVGYREGKLAYNFTAADLQVISEKLLSIDEVPDDEILLRTAVTKATGGQGYVKCMCLSDCSSGRCSCSRKRVLCNSRCHPGKSCNKYK